MPPKIHIKPSDVEITVEVQPGPHRGDVGDGVLTILDGKTEDVDCTLLLDVDGTKLRYEVDSRPQGLCDLTILFVPETRRLFLGGRSLSSVVDLDARTVEHRFEHCLFWGFDRDVRPGFVLETGELDCLFRALDGRILGQVPVDPPWETFFEPGGIRYVSSLYGSQLLPFPDAVG